MEEQLVCIICGDVIKFPKDKAQKAHDYCVYANDASKTFDNLSKNHHKANALQCIQKLAFALTGLETEYSKTMSLDDIRDSIIININKLVEVLEGSFNVDLGENKTDILSKRFELLQPFFRIEMISREIGYQKPHTFLGIIPATYYQAKRSMRVPKTWDLACMKHNVSPTYIRSGKGEIFLTEKEKVKLEEEYVG